MIIIANMSKKKKTPDNVIAQNKKARHEYFIEDEYEAGLVLEGWEVKSIRSGKVSLAESYIIMHRGEAFLHGCHITALITASTHINPEPQRNRKLLLHDKELVNLHAAINQSGYTIVPLRMYWKGPRVKLLIGTAKGKKLHDKRATEKDREWQRDKSRVLKHDTR
jgi:SsrA-binding protein